MDTLAIIKRIEMRLSEIGMSKAEFYKMTGISSASFSQWRTGTYKPTEKKLSSAAICLGVSLDYLVNGQTAEEEISFANGIHVFRSLIPEKLDSMLSNLEPNSYHIAYSAPGIVIAVEYDSPLTDDDIENLVNIYRITPTENKKAPAESGKRSVGNDILDEVDIAFYGEFKELDEDQKDTVRDMVRVMRERRAKKQEK